VYTAAELMAGAGRQTPSYLIMIHVGSKLINISVLQTEV
jgi:hypothetical protein